MLVGSGTIAINASDSRPQIKLAASSDTFALGVNGSTFEIADNVKLGTNARFSITNTGNVGIGTTSPSAKTSGSR
jgi:PBP1b-binding outer membrane lipoprotein LpoB